MPKDAPLTIFYALNHYLERFLTQNQLFQVAMAQQLDQHSVQAISYVRSLLNYRGIISAMRKLI